MKNKTKTEWLDLCLHVQAVYNRETNNIEFVNIDKLSPEMALDFASAATRFGLDNEIITPNKE